MRFNPEDLKPTYILDEKATISGLIFSDENNCNLSAILSLCCKQLITKFWTIFCFNKNRFESPRAQGGWVSIDSVKIGLLQ